jgi:PAS domain S-box-containing protein
MHSILVTTSLNSDSHPTQMAEALRNLQHAVAQSHDGVFFTDSTGIITRVNPAFEQFIGHSASELVGKDLSLLFESKSESAEYQLMWRRVFEGAGYAGNVKLTTKSGDSVEAEWIVTPVHGSRGRVVSLVGTSRPLGAAQEARATLSQSSAKNDRLFHDLKNILMIVVAYSDLARQGLAAGHPCNCYLESAISAAQSAAALINESAQGGRPRPIHNSAAAELRTENVEDTPPQTSTSKKKSKSAESKAEASDHIAGR